MSNLKNLTPEQREAAGRKARAKKSRIQQTINITSVKASRGDQDDGRRLPDEIPNIRTAIKWKCYDCMGWESDGCGSLAERVRQCECPHCPLYPWRGGKFDEDLLK